MPEINEIDILNKIPPGVKAAAARADELHQQIYGQAQEAGHEGDDAGDTFEGKPDERSPTPAPAPEPAPQAPVPQAQAETDGKARNWENDYKAMKGRYDSETGRLQSQLTTALEELRNLRGLIASMPVQTQQNAPDLNPKSLLTPEEVTEYGSEFLGVVGKKAKEEILPELSTVRSELEQIKSQINGVNTFVAESARDRMMNRLTEVVPGWEAQNEDPAFLAWLKLPNPYTGGIRHDELSAAWERNNTPRVLAFFNGFLAEKAATSPAGQQVQIEGAPAPKVDLAKLAAPGRAKTAAAAPAPTEKPSFTRSEIAKFYADVLNGTYKGRDAEKDRIEAQIFAAQREGRIT